MASSYYREKNGRIWWFQQNQREMEGKQNKQMKVARELLCCRVIGKDESLPISFLRPPT